MAVVMLLMQLRYACLAAVYARLPAGQGGTYYGAYYKVRKPEYGLQLTAHRAAHTLRVVQPASAYCTVPNSGATHSMPQSVPKFKSIQDQRLLKVCCCLHRVLSCSMC
jgi:hypothetical protein